MGARLCHSVTNCNLQTLKDLYHVAGRFIVIKASSWRAEIFFYLYESVNVLQSASPES